MSHPLSVIARPRSGRSKRIKENSQLKFSAIVNEIAHLHLQQVQVSSGYALLAMTSNLSCHCETAKRAMQTHKKVTWFEDLIDFSWDCSPALAAGASVVGLRPPRNDEQLFCHCEERFLRRSNLNEKGHWLNPKRIPLGLPRRAAPSSQ